MKRLVDYGTTIQQNIIFLFTKNIQVCNFQPFASVEKQIMDDFFSY
jgi:hypothetical protein